MFNAVVQSENRSFGEVVVRVQGTLDSSSFLDFYDFFTQLERNGFSKFILNLQDLEFLSSAGISVLIRVKRKLQEKDYSIVLIHLQPEVKELFRFFGFQKTFLIANDKESAEKLLESIYFLKAQEETLQKVVSNRFGIVEEDEPKPKEKTLKTDVISFGEQPKKDIEKNETSTTNVFETSPSFEDLPFVEEISTEPFLQSELESSDYEFTVPFITKSETGNSEIPLSIVEQGITQTGETFQEVRINCGKCGTKMRIVTQGIHRCPSCQARFSLRQSGSISTVEKLP